jgi:hypothetical protein
MKSKITPRRPRSGPTLSRVRDTGVTAREHYHREKARRARDPRPESDLIAAAKREYLALLAAEAVKGKGGRPKKKPPVNADTDLENEETEQDTE